jgi:hypothetical protein
VVARGQPTRALVPVRVRVREQARVPRLVRAQAQAWPVWRLPCPARVRPPLPSPACQPLQRRPGPRRPGRWPTRAATPASAAPTHRSCPAAALSSRPGWQAGRRRRPGSGRRWRRPDWFGSRVPARRGLFRSRPARRTARPCCCRAPACRDGLPRASGTPPALRACGQAAKAPRPGGTACSGPSGSWPGSRRSASAPANAGRL